MADEPVAAYPERSLQKVSRWLRRHRSWTYAAAAALVGITMVATFAVFVVDGARRGEESARKEAEANFKMAQQAVDDYLTNVSENTLFKEQDTLDIRNLRQELLESALPYYQRVPEGAKPRPAAPPTTRQCLLSTRRHHSRCRDVSGRAEVLPFGP